MFTTWDGGALLAGFLMLLSVHPSAQQSTDQAVTGAPSGTTGITAAPITNETVAEIQATDFICRSCNCLNRTVDCADKDVSKFFTLGDWKGLVSMEPLTVDLSYNSIVNVTRIFRLPIQTLNLSHNNIEFIMTASFKQLQKMRVLDLSYNKLTSAALNPHVFQGQYSAEEYEPLSSMRVLNLSGNDIHSLDQDLFEHMPELEELRLAENPFTIIDHVTLLAISGIPYLRILDFRGCQLEDIPDKFLHTPRNLWWLDLSNNLLEEVPEELEEAKSLRYLNLNNNPIEYISNLSQYDSEFPELQNLEELHLCKMPKLLEIHEGSMGELSALTVLHMSHNPALRFVHPNALSRKVGEAYIKPPIRELYMHSNNISVIDSRLLARWDLVTHIEIGDNPYLCDCSTQWMVDILVPLIEHIQPNSTDDWICQQPIEMINKTMRHLSEIHREMRCVDKYGHRPERDGAILIGVLIGVLLAVPACLGIFLLYKRGIFAACGVRGPADFSRAFYKRAHTDDFNF